MIRGRHIAELLLPWSGLIGAALGWTLTHQVGSNTFFDHCEAQSWWLVLLIGLLGLVLAIGGGLLAWTVWRRGVKETRARLFLALLGMLAGALFSVAILFQTIGGLIIPRCYG